MAPTRRPQHRPPCPTTHCLSYPRGEHIRAAEAERAFWSRVLLRPFFLALDKKGEATPLVHVSLYPLYPLCRIC